jgi:hypothetical protein
MPEAKAKVPHHNKQVNNTEGKIAGHGRRVKAKQAKCGALICNEKISDKTNRDHG